MRRARGANSGDELCATSDPCGAQAEYCSMVYVDNNCCLILNVCRHNLRSWVDQVS